MDKMFLITSEKSIDSLVSELKKGLAAGKKNQFAKVGEKRSLDANAQVWVWVPQIASFMGWTIPETNAELKLDHGLPILLSDPDAGKKTKFILGRCGFFDAGVSRQFQLNLVDFLPVTRLFSTKQHNAYRDSIQVHYAKQGLSLEYEGD